MKLFSIIIATMISQVLLAQNHPYEVKFSYEIEQKLAEGKINATRAGLLYSLIGDYQNSIQYSSIPVSWGIDSIDTDNFKITNALPLILEEAQRHNILVISENHLKPQHRVFADQLIQELAALGFQHLGMETLASISNGYELLDESLNERGYPLNSPYTGTYTMEPQMGNLVRNAIQANMTLFAYEKRQSVEGKDREEIQADNIIKYLYDNPNSKVIILCGFHHAIESNLIKRNNSYYMAKYLKDKLDIDPLTIYQDNFTEKQITDEHYQLQKLNVESPSVFVNKEGKYISLSEHVDIEVIHPKTTYLGGRPKWLYADKGRQPVKVDLENVTFSFPIIVEAYPSHETKSVPVDRLELKHSYDKKVLVLKEGNYRIHISDGENTYEYNQTVR